jgi:hypothetical protein
MMENAEWKWVHRSLIAGVFFFILMVFAGGMDCISGGCALVFVSIFLCITSFAVALLFYTRARAMDDILLGKDLLAHWVYPEEESKKSVEREYEEYRDTNKGLLMVVGFFLGIAILGMLIFGGEPGVMTAGILFLVFVLCAIAAWGAPKLERGRALKASHEALITKNGLIYEEAVYPFSSFLMRMDGVRYQKGTAKRPALLIFSFIQLVGLYILRPFAVSIPVPPGEEGLAGRIAKQLGGDAEEEGISESPGTVCSICGAPVEPGDSYCPSCGNKTRDE